MTTGKTWEQVGTELNAVEGLTRPEDRFLETDNPRDLAAIISGDYAEADRLQLAEEAAVVALRNIGDAYINPHVRLAAHIAARTALGIMPLPPEQEGEK